VNPSGLKRRNPAQGRVRRKGTEGGIESRSGRLGTLISAGLGRLLHHGGGVCDLPTMGALEGIGQQFVYETSHRLAPVSGLVVEDAHKIAFDAGRVVGSPEHKVRDRTAMFRTIKDL
jgi:hypothetical protein